MDKIIPSDYEMKKEYHDGELFIDITEGMFHLEVALFIVINIKSPYHSDNNLSFLWIPIRRELLWSLNNPFQQTRIV